MLLRFRTLLIAATTLLVASLAQDAAAQRITRAELDAELQRLFVETGARGMVVTIVRNGEGQVRGYGETKPGSGRRPDGLSLLRVNSTSKLFAADLLGNLVAEGRLDLDEPVQRYAAPGRIVPTAITLGQLATHTSGLPRSADLRAIHEPEETARWTWLAKQTQLPVPGRSALYSNIAFDLLADAIASKLGTRYTQLVQQRITTPLHMIDTTTTPSAEQCARLLDGGSGKDSSAPCSDQSWGAGSGGYYSTANDIGLWMKSQLAADRRAHAVQVRRDDLTSVEGLDGAGVIDGIALGWLHLPADEDHPALLEKTGGGGGFMSYLVLVPEADLGIFVAVSRLDGEVMKTLTRRTNDLAGLLAR